MIFFGDRGLEARDPLPPLSYYSPHAVRGNLGNDAGILQRSLSWSEVEMHRGMGNAALADGSVQQLTSSGLRAFLARSGDTNGQNNVIQPGKGPN
jgi:prepilin-type processing-associated H-X9-DG protein